MTPTCPSCQQGKHATCDGDAWDHELDEVTLCQCTTGACQPRDGDGDGFGTTPLPL